MASPKERLEKVLSQTGNTYNSLAKAIGLKRSQSLYDIRDEKIKNISGGLASQIAICYPEINKEWLETGAGEMVNIDSGDIDYVRKGDVIDKVFKFKFKGDFGYESLKSEILASAKDVADLFETDLETISINVWGKPNFLTEILHDQRGIHVNTLKALKKRFPSSTAADKSIRKPKTETKEEVIPAFDQVVAQQGKMIENLMPTTETDKAGLVKKEMFRNAQFVIRSSGNSMLPNYPPDAWIGIRRVEDISPGSVYALDLGSDLVLKRVYWKNDDQYSGIIECFSDNTMVEDSGARKGRLKYPPYEIDATKIKGVYKVTDVYRPNEITVLR